MKTNKLISLVIGGLFVLGMQMHADDWQLVRTFAHQSKIVSVAISSDNRLVVTGSWDRTAQVWDIASGACRHILVNSDSLWSAAISSDNRFVVTGSGDGTARIWDVETGKCLHTLSHYGTVTSVAISSDNRLVVTGSWDRTARIWDVETGDCLHTLGHDGAVISVAISSDNRFVVTGSDADDMKARIWEDKEIALRNERRLAFMSVWHTRLGAESPLARLPLELLNRIAKTIDGSPVPGMQASNEQPMQVADCADNVHCEPRNRQSGWCCVQ